MASKKGSVAPIVLPNGKVGTLPPRKRARTQEEKEQRRIERIIRNRRAAHASREKKRRHVEQLEGYAKKLEECIAHFTESQEELLAVQKQLVDRLDANEIDYSDIDVASSDAINAVERPDDLDLDTSLHPVKRQKTASTSSACASPEKEIDSPVYETIGTPDDELDAELEIKQKQKSAPTELPLSPPPSTSPSKFRLNDREILKRSYSNLFDDADEAAATTGGNGDLFMMADEQQADNSLQLFDEAGNAAIDSIYQNQDELFRSDNVEYLDCLNDVHHSAVMMFVVAST